MSATLRHPSIAFAAAPRRLRFGVEMGVEAGIETGTGGRDVRWLLKRNCSATPRQVLIVYAMLCTVSLGIAAFCWVQGATLVMPFAWLELLGLGIALLVYARHAGDLEAIRLQAGRLTVEHIAGRHVERAEFAPSWVRVEPEHGDGSLIELSGHGQRIAIGRFVRPELRRQLADELRWALRRWAWVQPGSVAPEGAPAGAAQSATSQDKSEN